MNFKVKDSLRTEIKGKFNWVGKTTITGFVALRGEEIEGKAFLRQITEQIFASSEIDCMNREYDYAIYEGENHILLCHLSSNIKSKPTSSLVSTDKSKGEFSSVYPSKVMVRENA